MYAVAAHQATAYNEGTGEGREDIIVEGKLDVKELGNRLSPIRKELQAIADELGFKNGVSISLFMGVFMTAIDLDKC